MKIDKAEVLRALSSSRARKCGLWILAAVVLFGVLGFFAAPPIVRHVAAEKLSEILHRPVEIRRVAVNPFAMTLTVEGLEVKEREGEGVFAGFGGLFVNLQASSLFRWGPVVDEIRLTEPKFHVVRLSQDRYNFSDLLDEFAGRPAEAGKADAAEGKPPAFSLNNIQISGGTLEFDDRVVNEKHVVGDIALKLPFVSSMSYATDSFVEPYFSAKVNGAPLEIKGRSKPFTESRESEFKLELDDVQLPRYFDYLPVKIPVKLVSGALDTDLTLVFGLAQGKPKLTLSGTAAVRDLKATEAGGAPLLSFNRLDVALASVEPFGGKFAIERAALDSPEVSARVSKAGALNWLELLPATPATPGGAKAEAPGADASKVEWSLGEAKLSGGALHWSDESNARPFKAEMRGLEAEVRNLDGQGAVADFEAAGRLDGGEALKLESIAVKGGKLDLAKRRVRLGELHLKGGRAAIVRLADGRIEWLEPPALRASKPAAQGAEAPWTVEVAKAAGEDFGARFEDAAVSPRAIQTVEGMSFELANVSTEPGRTMDVKTAFKLNRKGEISADGKLAALPRLDAEINVGAKTVDLLPFQPYFGGRLNVEIKRGHATVSGKARVQQAEKTGAFSGGFAGQATIGDFQSVDKANSAEFLRWKSFHLGQIDARFGPESATIGDIALSDFFARVIVSPEGKLNLLQIVRSDEKPAAAPGAKPAEAPAEAKEGEAAAPVAEGKAPAVPIAIGKITLQGGSVRFTDNFVKPNYTANLKEIGGRVAGLSSDPATQAELELRGSYDGIAPLNVSARINPLAAKPFLDLQADVKGVDLTSLSAYSGKYAGYAIEKGKLSLSVKYKIENDLLEAENRVFLDQLTFGDAVESPDATGLPVRLAVSLLKNRDGEIDINLPISGSLNDPQFSVGGLIVKVVVNLLTKAATSPFALIGSMFGGGEELSEVEFDAGRAALTPEAVKRLENLAKALNDRPALKFEIEGRADADQDPEGLKRARLERKVRAAGREQASERGEDAAAPGEASAPGEIPPQDYPALLERVYRAESFPKPRNMVGLVKSLPVEEMEKLILAHSVVGDDDLKELGDRRAKAVRDWLAAHQVAAERIFLLPSKIAPAGEGKSGRRANFSLK